MLSNAPVNAALPAKDIKRAKKFYQDTLGLQIKSEDDGGIVFKSKAIPAYLYILQVSPALTRRQLLDGACQTWSPK